MKEVITLYKTLHVRSDIPHGAEMSLGEFFSMLEDNCKKEFFYDVVSKINFSRKYLFKVEVVDSDIEHGWNWTYPDTIVETFKFSMWELEPDEDVFKKEEKVMMFNLGGNPWEN